MKNLRLNGASGLMVGMALVVAIVAAGGLTGALSQGKVVRIGVNLPFTGADTADVELIKDGIVMAIDEQNAKGGVAGYKIDAAMYDSSTTTAGGFDIAQAATNARKAAGDPSIVALLGPYTSGEGKAMSPILSDADLATITGTATNPDLTDPKFADKYRPKGKAIFFRTVTTDAYQAPGMLNFMVEKLNVKTAYIIDDGDAYGVGAANAFEKHAPEKGLKILGRDRINPKEADYTTILTKIKGLDPQAVFYGGHSEAGAKVAKQGYDVIPKIIKVGLDGMYNAQLLKAVGYPAIGGWYVSVASPHLLDSPELQPWVSRFAKKFGKSPEDYSITSYDATMVIFDAIQRVVKSGKPVDRHTVRDAIQATHLKTLQGDIAFDANGDLTTKIISIFQIVRDAKFPEDDILHQYKYIGVAPEN
jgi:branched-chain amino acid transport system substrate-binding protein